MKRLLKDQGDLTLAHGKTQTVYEMESISERASSRLTAKDGTER